MAGATVRSTVVPFLGVGCDEAPDDPHARMPREPRPPPVAADEHGRARAPGTAVGGDGTDVDDDEPGRPAATGDPDGLA